MHVIIFKTVQIYPQLVIGPFASFGEAYDRLCELPAPGPGGHKYIEEITPLADVPTALGHEEGALVEYRGNRVDGDAFAGKEVNGVLRELNARFDIRRHSPDGFEWGYEGSGPAQLAIAILCDAIGPEKAELIYQQFKSRAIATIESDSWCISRDRVRQIAGELLDARR